MAKLSIILQTCAYLLSTLVWMAQILLIQHRSERDMVQNYTQLKPISQVKNTKPKRIMKRITRNAIIMICPFRLAFFMTIATLFCIQTKGEVSDCSNWYKVNGNRVKHILPTLWSLSATTLANMQFHEMHAELLRKWGGKDEEGSWQMVLRWSRRYKPAQSLADLK